jgi:alkylation response protein AidB-like acyl-CoA dehydrogenase
MIDRERPRAAKYAAMAKAFSSDLYRKATDVATHVHGGYGFTMEGDIQLYYRKAKAMELTFGDGDYNRALMYGLASGSVEGGGAAVWAPRKVGDRVKV